MNALALPSKGTLEDLAGRRPVNDLGTGGPIEA